VSDIGTTPSERQRWFGDPRAYGPRSEAAPELPRARDLCDTPAHEWEAYVQGLELARRRDAGARLNALHAGTYRAGE
jgi:hypothetical protein